MPESHQLPAEACCIQCAKPKADITLTVQWSVRTAQLLRKADLTAIVAMTHESELMAFVTMVDPQHLFAPACARPDKCTSRLQSLGARCRSSTLINKGGPCTHHFPKQPPNQQSTKSQKKTLTFRTGLDKLSEPCEAHSGRRMTHR